MPRTARHAPVGMIFHVPNRGNARDQIFDKEADYAAFEKVLSESLLDLSPFLPIKTVKGKKATGKTTKPQLFTDDGGAPAA